MAYTASALSLLLAGFKKPIVMTGAHLACIKAGLLVCSSILLVEKKVEDSL